MGNLDEKARSIPQYDLLLSKMLEEDKRRLEYTIELSKEMRILTRTLYSSMKWPVKLVHPMFEARTAYAVPNNYFQNIRLDDERLGNSFAHGAMRSVFFVGDRLVLFSKSVNFRDAREFFTSFLLLHLEKGEYKHIEGKGEVREIHLRADVEKPMKNLVTGKVEKKRVAFNFVQQPVQGRIVSKEQVTQSARFRKVYAKYGGAQMKSASIDMEGYAITVPHFSPHPYMLQLCRQFGYEDNKDFQLHVADYFKEHL